MYAIRSYYANGDGVVDAADYMTVKANLSHAAGALDEDATVMESLVASYNFV